MNEDIKFYNFLFETEGEWPIFVAIKDNGEDPETLLPDARAEAANIYEVFEKDLEYGGCFDDDEAEMYGYDTYTLDDDEDDND